ncbi:DUF3592 domain-containing protein [Nocardiopsis trehalosi]|uniref:DUF3592 domain-containing protein n=1 Tax=Nocardiopsis trehalosi TaxID=109329 RepID=UPI00082C01ED|nr:DUF3592 domain-containing protein [Nocardiopsis trehalosi]
MLEYYPLLPMAAGAVLLAVLFRHVRASSLLARKGVRTQGVIEGYEETRRTSRMVVRFRTGDGREVRAAHTSTGWTAARAGDTVTVSYDPAEPERARIVEARWLSSGIDVVFGLLGTALIGIGALLGVLAW